MTKLTSMTTVAYLRQELAFTLPQFSKMSKQDREDLKEWAAK